MTVLDSLHPVAVKARPRRVHGLLAAVLCLGAGGAQAATDHTDTGWFMGVNTTRLSPRWVTFADVQVRSSDGWDDVRTLILRPALTFEPKPGVGLTAGYALVRTYSSTGPDTTEHRSWQQLGVAQPVGRVALNHRLRLEQRFIEQASGRHVYADRLRYLLRGLLPLDGSRGADLARGPYLAAQNEVFFHLSHGGDLNGQVFDQNRAYAGAGYRLDKAVDVELGYLNQYVAGRTRDTSNHAVLASVFTRF